MTKVLLTKVGICGPDETVAPYELAKLCYDFRHTNPEIGVLFARNKEGEPRYPGAVWRQELIATGLLRGHLAAHLCSESIHQFCAQEPALMDELARYSRVQLNIPKSILDVGGKTEQLRDACDTLVARYPDTKIIFQYTHNSESRFWMFSDLANVQALFDESGGKSRAADTYPEPFSHTHCGYTGGLTPESLVERLGFISGFVGQTPIWIDAEGGFRDPENTALFSLPRARAFLQAAADNAVFTPHL